MVKSNPPNEKRKADKMAAELTEDDLVFTMVGNGVSSLLTLLVV